MNILVISKISIPAKDRTLPAWEYLRANGHTVIVDHPEVADSPSKGKFKPDAMISMGVTVMDETFQALERFSGVPLFAYNWDCYEWVWEPGMGGKKQAHHEMRGVEYDYVRYGELLRRATEVWVPSECTGRRTTQWWGIEHWRVILSAIPWWESKAVADRGYALCTLRHIPDPWDTVFEECCEELAIPYRRTDHQLSRAEYEDAVAGCRFLVNHYYEASTGGLTLLEGYYHGKPVLCSDSEWNGARDYLGQRARYFRYGDRIDFKLQLLDLFHHPERAQREWGAPGSLERRKAWIRERFSDQRMVDDMMERIHANQG